MATIDKALLQTEYRTLRKACGLIDRSERGKLALTGSEAVDFLNGQVTNELADLRPGEGRYAAFLTHKGKMLGDVRILACGEHASRAPSELLLDTERVALQELFEMIRRFKIGHDVELHKRTLERGLLSLIGPESERIAGAEQLGGPEHANECLKIGPIPALAVRTDVGIDLICDATGAERLTRELLGRGAAPVTPEAAECLRVERGRPRYGIDLDSSTIPQEAGLNDRAVSFTKGCYVGQETVARLHYRGKPNRRLRGLRLSEMAPAGDELSFEGRSVGQLSSVVPSPRFGPIGLALVRREAPPGSTVSVGEAVTAEVTELPFR